MEVVKEKLWDLFQFAQIGYNVHDFVNGFFTEVYENEEIMSYKSDTHNYVISVRVD